MRICHVLLYYDPAYTDPEGYFEHAPVMRHLPQALARLGHDVHVVLAFPTNHAFIEEGVHYHFVRAGRLLNTIARRLAQWLGRKPAALEPAFRAIQTIRRLQPDVIHFHGTNIYVNHRLLLAALGRKRPAFVLHYHGGYPSPYGMVRRVQRYNFRHTACFLFTTKAHAQPFLDAGLFAPAQVHELMQVSTAFRRTARAEARRHTGMRGHPVFLWAGRLHPIKDPLTALRGFAAIHTAWPDAHLYLYYRTDELLPELQAFVATRPGLASHVHFCGYAPFAQMEAIFNSADIFLQASQREFSGRATLEAMACGVVPAVTAIPSFRAMTDDGRYGVLFPVGDAEALARGVLAMPPDTLPDRSRRVRAWFEQSLSFSALARQLDTIYRDVLGEMPES